MVREAIFKQATRAAGNGQGLEFVLSDETRDSYGDIILASGWQLARFRKNPVALYAHNQGALPIGAWKNVRVDGKRLLGRLELAKPGTPAATDAVEAIRSLLDQGILRSVSVGFLPLEAEPIDKENPWDGLRILSAELVECSVVPVPANPNATQMRALSALARSTRAALAATGTAPLDYDRKAILAALGSSSQTRAQTMKTLKDKIKEKRAEIVTLSDELEPLNEALAGDGLDDDQAAEFDRIAGSLDSARADLNRLEIAQRAAGGEAENQPNRGLSILAPPPSRTPGVPGVPLDRRGLDSLYAQAKAPQEKAFDLFAKILAAQVLAHKQRLPFDRAMELAYPERGDLAQLAKGILLSGKAATLPAQTTVAGWAAELVRTGYREFLEALTASSVYARLTSLPGAYRFTFGTDGKVVLPKRAPPVLGQTGDLSGAFVGEGKPIPVRRGIIGSVTLTPKKMAVISEFTQEMADSSVPQIEQLIRSWIIEDTARTIDSALLDAGGGTAIRPAGLGNGVVAIPGDAGGDEAALRADLKAALTPFVQGNAATGLAWLMNPSARLALTLMTNALGVASPFAAQAANGNLAGIPIVDSTNVGLTDLWLVRFVDLATAQNDTPQFSVSDQATLHEVEAYAADFTAGPEVLPIATGAAGAAVVATPIRSLWQTDSIAIRMILPMDWSMLRDGMVVKITGITWA